MPSRPSRPVMPRGSRDAWGMDALVHESLVSPADAEAIGADLPEWVATAVVERGAPAERVAMTMAQAARVPVADLARAEPAAIQLVPEPLARLHCVLPLSATSRAIRLATANPNDLDAEQALAFATSRDVVFQYALPHPLLQRLDEMYRPERQIERLVQGLGATAEIETFDEPSALPEMPMAPEAPTARLVDAMIADAVRERASDIHCEPGESGLVVRYRIDGVLREVMKVPRAAAPAVGRRVKVMGRMDVSDPLRPHDGRAMARVDGKEWDLRISSVPIARLGEKVVIRLLDPAGANLKLEAMGLWPDELADFGAPLQHREGIVLVTGPTGSGKTSTLYAALDRIRTKAINVVTVEDPVEYRLEGVNQIQVSEKQGLTFASALRSVLRQDPDVVLLGEIRDHETAQTAWQAALSGHFVLSTLHTNDAATTIMRLVDIGIEPFKIAAALKGVVAQRLVRRLCPHCAAPADVAALPPQAQPPAGHDGPVTVRAPGGCEKCLFTGYRGRFALEEILRVEGEVAELIAEGASAERLMAAGRREGTRTLWEAGLRRVWSGDTGYDEVVRVVGEAAPGKTRLTSGHPASAGRLSLPATMPPAPAAAIPESGTPAAGHASDERPLILVVDDDETTRVLEAGVLEAEGFRVAEAPDGIAGLLEAQRLHPALVLLDMDMPRLDGFGVLGALRQTLSGRSIPIIVVTARDDPQTEVRCIELGAEDFISKPIHPTTLTARVKAVLRRVAARA